MARLIYGADGSAQVVSPTGVPTTAAATVKTARTGGSTVTDIQNMSNANLGGVVTPDSRGQIIFQGPDGASATYWLDFGDGGPRWAIKPVDFASLVSGAMTARDLANYGAPSNHTPEANLPYTANTPEAGLALALEGLVIPRFASSGARDIAFASPSDGDRCYRTDLHAGQTYRTGLGIANRWVTDMALIAEQKVASDGGAVTFSSIPQEWRSLVIKYHGRGFGSPSTDLKTQRVSLRFNSDSGSNYASWGQMRMLKVVSNTNTFEVNRDGTGGSATATTAANYGGSQAAGLTNFTANGVTTMHIGVLPGSDFSSLWGGGEITIENYTESFGHKAVKGVSGFGDAAGNTGTGYTSYAILQGGWQSGAAITSINLSATSATGFAAGSYFALYGLS